MGIFVGIGNYIGRVRQIGDGGGQPIGPNDYYIITEDGISVLTERGKHILLDKYDEEIIFYPYDSVELNEILNSETWQQQE